MPCHTECFLTTPPQFICLWTAGRGFLWCCPLQLTAGSSRRPRAGQIPQLAPRETVQPLPSLSSHWPLQEIIDPILKLPIYMSHFLLPYEGSGELPPLAWPIFEWPDLCNYHVLEINTSVCPSTDSLFHRLNEFLKPSGFEQMFLSPYTIRTVSAAGLCTEKQEI